MTTSEFEMLRSDFITVRTDNDGGVPDHKLSAWTPDWRMGRGVAGAGREFYPALIPRTARCVWPPIALVQATTVLS